VVEEVAMADEEDVRRIAASLPETSVEVNDCGQLGVSFRGKGLAWTWLERSAPRARRLPNRTVLAVRVAGAEEKEELVAADSEKFFTEPHYNGYPAVLVRLAAVDTDELTELLTDAWRARAPKRLAKDLGI
jgi:hypothetical protein